MGAPRLSCREHTAAWEAAVGSPVPCSRLPAAAKCLISWVQVHFSALRLCFLLGSTPEPSPCRLGGQFGFGYRFPCSQESQTLFHGFAGIRQPLLGSDLSLTPACPQGWCTLSAVEGWWRGLALTTAAVCFSLAGLMAGRLKAQQSSKHFMQSPAPAAPIQVLQTRLGIWGFRWVILGAGLMPKPLT